MIFNTGDKVRIRLGASNGTHWGQTAKDADFNRTILTVGIKIFDGISRINLTPGNYWLYDTDLELVETEKWSMDDMTDTLVEEPPKEDKKLTASEKKFLKQKEVVKSAIISATQQFIKKNQYDVIHPSMLDEKQIALNERLNYFYNSINNSHAIELAKMFSIVLGKPVSHVAQAARTINWTRFGALVPLIQGSHNYTLHKVAIITQDGRAIRYDGTIGNTLNADANMYRPATADEINAISNETYAALIREFLVMA